MTRALTAKGFGLFHRCGCPPSVRTTTSPGPELVFLLNGSAATFESPWDVRCIRRRPVLDIGPPRGFDVTGFQRGPLPVPRRLRTERGRQVLRLTAESAEP